MKARKTRRDQKPGRYVALFHWLMNTAAWQSLGPVERSVYIELARRYAGAGSNNGRLPYSVREAADALHIGKSTAARALLVLQERGFIVQVKGGTFHRKSRHSTEWRLTEFGCDVTGSLATKNFTRWQPKTQNPVPPQDRTVPVAGPIGPRSGTVPFQKPVTVPETGPRSPFWPPHRYL
jgi:DNA-binding transcriptional MocR family regulator